MRRIGWLVLVGIIFALTGWFYPIELPAEVSTDFSGVWHFERDKSIAAEGTSFSDAEVTLEILQKQDSVKITKTIKTAGGMEDVITDEFVLDGKERILDEAPAITKKTGNWSADRKQMILVLTVSIGSRIMSSEDTYSLTDNGKGLTIHSNENMNSKMSKQTLVYTKKN